jgi:hypothetical protein
MILGQVFERFVEESPEESDGSWVIRESPMSPDSR